MKTFSLAFSILLAFPVFGQNYRTVSTDSEVYFDFKEATNLSYSLYGELVSRVILTDSFQVINSDTIIYQRFNQEFEINHLSVYDSVVQVYREIYCHAARDTGFLSYKTIIQNDGMDIFFNRFHDSIFIQTQSDLNDTWIFYQNPNGSYFEATVINIDNETFLGLTDSVKTISLQAKDSSGNIITSPYDTLDIKISQHYGLIQGFNFFRFPYGTTTGENYPSVINFKPIKIIGLPEYNKGIKNLTIADVYDYDIGDEFHWYNYVGYGDSNGSFRYKVYDLMTINNKFFSSNGDSVYYDVYWERYREYKQEEYWNNIFIHSFDTIYTKDTIVGYDISPNHQMNMFTLHQDSDSLTWIQTEDGNKKVIDYGDVSTWNTNGCFEPGEIRSAGSTTFHKGIGFTYSYGGVGIPTEERTFLYYNKNGTTWGTPLNIDSLSTVSTKLIVKNGLNIKIFPNPTNNLLNFQFKEPIDNAEIRIYSSIGQLMTNQNIRNTDIQFEVSDWHSGMYFYGVYVEGVLVKQGQILVKE